MGEITYAKVGGPPTNWATITVHDMETGEEIADVVEVNAVEGWLERYRRVDGKIVRHRSHPLEPPEAVTERVEGRFEIRTKAA